MRTRVGAALVAGAVTLSGAVPVLAQTSPSTPTEARAERPRREAVARVVEEELGMSRREIATALARGETLADLAAAQGSSGEELAAVLQTRAAEAIDEALASGRLDAERAVELTTRATERIQALVFEPHRRVGRKAVARVARRHALGTISELLGLSPDELRAELQEGRTVADVAADRGVELDDIVETVMAPVEERVAEAVASGRIDEDRVAERLDHLRERLRRRLTTPVDGVTPRG